MPGHATRVMEFLTSILQMGLLLFGRQVDQQQVQALVSNVLAASKVLHDRWKSDFPHILCKSPNHRHGAVSTGLHAVL